jgi:hypothetical protein
VAEAAGAVRTASSARVKCVHSLPTARAAAGFTKWAPAGQGPGRGSERLPRRTLVCGAGSPTRRRRVGDIVRAARAGGSLRSQQAGRSSPNGGQVREERRAANPARCAAPVYQLGAAGEPRWDHCPTGRGSEGPGGPPAPPTDCGTKGYKKLQKATNRKTSARPVSRRRRLLEKLKKMTWVRCVSWVGWRARRARRRTRAQE